MTKKLLFTGHIAVMALCAAVATAQAQSTSVGDIAYLEDSLQALNAEFERVGVQTSNSGGEGGTRWYRVGDLQSGFYEDFVVRLAAPGWIAVGADRDTQSITLTRYDSGQLAGWDRGSGVRAASLYFGRAGTYTVRMHMDACSEAYCIYTIMAGFR
jgi:hypothetical protein